MISAAPKSWSALVLALASSSLVSGCQAPPQSSQAPSSECSLVLIDSFDGSHGPTVEKTAKSLGDIPSTYRLSQSDKGDPPYIALQKQLGRDLGQQPLTREDSRLVLDRYIVESYRQPMQMLTSLMHDAIGLGVSHSALNISLGLNQLDVVEGAEAKARERVYRDNLDRALGLPSQEVSSGQRKQALLERVGEVLQASPGVEEARLQWMGAVDEFETQHNSVVVSAGNSGGEFRQLQQAGYRIDPDLDRNFLAEDNVTVVAANDWLQAVASYSRQGAEVDVIADGNGGLLSQGTSLAAPRVSAALRAVHCQNPHFSSQEAQDYLQSQLSQPTEGQQAPTLHLGKVRDLIGR